MNSPQQNTHYDWRYILSKQAIEIIMYIYENYYICITMSAVKIIWQNLDLQWHHGQHGYQTSITMKKAMFNLFFQHKVSHIVVILSWASASREIVTRLNWNFIISSPLSSRISYVINCFHPMIILEAIIWHIYVFIIYHPHMHRALLVISMSSTELITHLFSV